MKRDFLTTSTAPTAHNKSSSLAHRIFSSVSFSVLALLPVSWYQPPQHGGCLVSITDLQKEQIQQKTTKIWEYQIFIDALAATPSDVLNAVDSTRLPYGAVPGNQLTAAEGLLRQSWEIDPGKSLLLPKTEQNISLTEEDIRWERARVELLRKELSVQIVTIAQQSCWVK